MTVFRGRWGTHYYRFWHRKQKYEKGGFPTKLAAGDAEDRRMREVGKRRGRGGAALDAPDERLDVYAQAWLDGIAPDVAPATLASYTWGLQHVLPELGALTLRQVTRRHVLELLERKRRTGLSKDSVRLIRAPLSALFADALDRELVTANPVASTGRRGRRRRPHQATRAERERRIKPMSLEQRDAFLALAAEVLPRRAVLLELLAKCGLRPSEALWLRPEDLALDHARGPRLHVERGVDGRPTKTEETRWVEVPCGLAGRLARAMRSHAITCDHLFASRKGTPLTRRFVRRCFLRLLLEQAIRERMTSAGIKRAKAISQLREERWRPPHRLYDLRHTYASLRLAAGAPITYVQAQLGHADPVTTLRHYARWIPTEGRQWVEDDGG